MNKTAARKMSKSEAVTFGQLKAMIATAKVRGGMSRVNSSLTMEQACDIYEGAVRDRDDNEIPKGEVYSPVRNKYVASRDSLIVRNILRDCN